jgi:uncharacterized membrane protein
MVCKATKFWKRDCLAAGFYLKFIAMRSILDLSKFALHPKFGAAAGGMFMQAKTNQKSHLRYLVTLAFLAAILFVMDLTGIAMIPLPGQYASIMTVPVAVGAMMLGPTAGGVLGGVMGMISFYTALKTGFRDMNLMGYGGATVFLLTAFNSFVPRILMGIATGWIFKLLKKVDKTNTLCYYVGGLAAPLLNTVLFMSVLIPVFMNAPNLIGLLGETLYAKFKDGIFLFAIGYVGIQAVLEAVIGCILSGSISKALCKVVKR